jgi:hypothetical protein
MAAASIASRRLSGQHGVSARAEMVIFSEINLDSFHCTAHFQCVLKQPKSMKDLETRASGALRALLEQVPSVCLHEVSGESAARDSGIDFLVEVAGLTGQPRALACSVNVSGQPRHVRAALSQLRDYATRNGPHVTPILIAPYLSPDAQALCRERDVAFLDLEGNARLVFDGVFIERTVASRPAVARREMKSLFKPKAAQVLRVMLRDPSRAWRVVELAAAAGVSLGQTSNVRSALLAREWGQVSNDGLFLSSPDALMDAWRDEYEPVGDRLAFYTTLHGAQFDEAARGVLLRAGKRAALASFSAAQWLAPYARTSTQYFYADHSAIELLQASLKLNSASKGENVVVTRPKDLGVFRDLVEPAPGVICTSDVQTYLDLSAAGERGREAADHLRREKLQWKK